MNFEHTHTKHLPASTWTSHTRRGKGFPGLQYAACAACSCSVWVGGWLDHRGTSSRFSISPAIALVMANIAEQLAQFSRDGLHAAWVRQVNPLARARAPPALTMRNQGKRTRSNVSSPRSASCVRVSNHHHISMSFEIPQMLKLVRQTAFSARFSPFVWGGNQFTKTFFACSLDWSSTPKNIYDERMRE